MHNPGMSPHTLTLDPRRWIELSFGWVVSTLGLVIEVEQTHMFLTDMYLRMQKHGRDLMMSKEEGTPS